VVACSEGVRQVQSSGQVHIRLVRDGSIAAWCLHPCHSTSGVSSAGPACPETPWARDAEGCGLKYRKQEERHVAVCRAPR